MSNYKKKKKKWSLLCFKFLNRIFEVKSNYNKETEMNMFFIGVILKQTYSVT